MCFAFSQRRVSGRIHLTKLNNINFMLKQQQQQQQQQHKNPIFFFQSPCISEISLANPSPYTNHNRKNTVLTSHKREHVEYRWSLFTRLKFAHTLCYKCNIIYDELAFFIDLSFICSWIKLDQDKTEKLQNLQFYLITRQIPFHQSSFLRVIS
jgi:hypothetical protein